MTPNEALKEAIRLAGGEAAIARAIGVSPQAVNQWDAAPPLRVLEIERAAQGKVTRHDLRPDLYPVESDPDAPPQTGQDTVSPEGPASSDTEQAA